MHVKDAIESRRAYRILDEVKIDKPILNDLIGSAMLAPSCFNNQPWRFLTIYQKEGLEAMKGALSKGNEWARDASAYVVVYSRKDLDCNIQDRHYYLFDTGMATAFLMLRATELNLVAHPIAGFSPKKIKELFGISKDMMVITVVVLGKKGSEPGPLLSNEQIETETERPERLSIDEIRSFG
ncbi:MAG TPA: nitroreductase [Euryarchaeota archaeon]|nr:nitroreductase [Euryarchaeota archaeon]